MTIPPEVQFFLGGLIGTAARILISSTQANVNVRSFVETFLGGVTAMVLGTVGVLETLPLVGDDFMKMTAITKSGVLCLLAAGGSYAYRAFEFRRNGKVEKTP